MGDLAQLFQLLLDGAGSARDGVGAQLERSQFCDSGGGKVEEILASSATASKSIFASETLRKASRSFVWASPAEDGSQYLKRKRLRG